MKKVQRAVKNLQRAARSGDQGPRYKARDTRPLVRTTGTANLYGYWTRGVASRGTGYGVPPKPRAMARGHRWVLQVFIKIQKHLTRTIIHKQIYKNFTLLYPRAMNNLPTDTLELSKILQDGRHFSEKRGELVHIIDSLTGVSVAIFPQSNDLPETLYPQRLANGSVVYTPHGAPMVSGGYREITYSPLTVDLICQKIVEGESLTKICKDPKMPSYTSFCKWRRAHPWIDEALAKAREDRAENFRDKALEEAEAADSRDPLGAHALRVETYKWAASVDNSRYNPKTKVEATITNPTVIQVVTGIDRGPKDVK